MPVSQPESVREPAFISAVAGLAPDLVVVAAYGKILPGALLDIPASGCINVHASLLPCYRGAAPVNRAVMNGEVNTGVTVQKMAPALDSGDVILQMKTEIGSGEGADDLYSRLGALGAEAAVAAVLGARKGMEASPQDGMGVATWAPPLKKEDGLLDWTRAAVELHNRVRGLRPWPGAYSYMEGRRIRVLRARPAPGADVSPGRVVGVGPDSIAVSTGDGALELLELQAEGGRSMSAVEFARGVRNLAGKVFSANGTGGPR
jgi:methionyl-tRNA formyltransferase